MKSDSKASNSQGVIRVCALALGAMLAASLPAKAVSQRVADGYGPPGFSVFFSSPAGVGGISSSTAYMTINPISVYAVVPNNDSHWSPLQKLTIDWTIYYYDSVRQTWFQFHQVSNSSYYVYDYTTGRTNVVWNAISFPVVPGYAYTFSLRIGWVNPAPSPGGGAMAAAYYWFDQPGDLRCSGAYNCSLLSLKPTGLVFPNFGPQRGSVQALYIHY